MRSVVPRGHVEDLELLGYHGQVCDLGSSAQLERLSEAVRYSEQPKRSRTAGNGMTAETVGLDFKNVGPITIKSNRTGGIGWVMPSWN